MARSIKILSCSSTENLSKKIAKSFGQPLAKVEVQKFSDGEFGVSIKETVRGCDVFIIQSTVPPQENLMEMLLMIDAAKRASAHKIIAVLPYFGWARQDRKDQPRVAIGAKLVANMLVSAGVNRVMTMDLHADQIQGFFEVPVDHLYGSTLFAPYLKSKNLSNLIIAAPDAGGSKRANAYAKYLNVDLALCYKQRKKANEIDNMTIIGDVQGKDVVIIDDMIDTAGTLTKAAQLFIDNGASSVYACCTHAILSGPAHERIENSVLKELVVTDTINIKKENSKIKVLSVADLFAEVMSQHVKYKSISKHFLFAN
ncbi:MAG: ribose-phosphate pyrophosphokinase [Crocinitomicaceae bacterium]|nr:ribose-phosphate pyrophosphokinase [Crocinitomicaceae bacterium]|tara:strand:- start:2540 stop:3478 length:939 start_codon:yes stop_codon:yes gene_type:complete